MSLSRSSGRVSLSVFVSQFQSLCLHIFRHVNRSVMPLPSSRSVPSQGGASLLPAKASTVAVSAGGLVPATAAATAEAAATTWAATACEAATITAQTAAAGVTVMMPVTGTAAAAAASEAAPLAANRLRRRAASTPLAPGWRGHTSGDGTRSASASSGSL